jgi:hypothetical protein
MNEAPPDGDREREEVATVLESLRAGVRQRLAETATQGGTGGGGTGGGATGGAQARLLRLRQSEYVREPAPSSHRARTGRFIVLGRRAVYKLFARWIVRPLLEQHNAFNEASAATIEELLDRQERLQAELRETRTRLERLERRTPAGEPAGP